MNGIHIIINFVWFIPITDKKQLFINISLHCSSLSFRDKKVVYYIRSIKSHDKNVNIIGKVRNPCPANSLFKMIPLKPFKLMSSILAYHFKSNKKQFSNCSLFINTNWNTRYTLSLFMRYSSSYFSNWQRCKTA